MLERLRRAVGIVERNVVDLAPVDAAAIVDRFDLSEHTLAYLADRGRQSAEGEYASDLDLGRRDARRFARPTRRRGNRDNAHRKK
jgi:hypothetical protein